MTLKIVANSCLFSLDDLTYLNTTGGSPTNADIWTLSVWLKRSQNATATGLAETIFAGGPASTDYSTISIEADDKIRFHHVEASATIYDVITTATFRDPTAWYHLVVRYDSTEVVSTDRIRFWINGVQLTDFDTSTFPALSDSTWFNISSDEEIGRKPGGTEFFDGYMAEFAFVDGSALSPTDFAEQVFNTWQPITFSPTYGVNGFLLEFLVAASLGDDTSGNASHFNENIIVAANQREDSPTQNHLTLHASHHGNNHTTQQGALEYHAASGSFEAVTATALLPKTGKYYWEVNADVVATTNEAGVGIGSQLGSLSNLVGSDNQSWGFYNNAGTALQLRHDSVNTPFADTGTFQTGDYVQIAFDADTGKLWFGLNGTFLDSGDPGAGTGEHVTITDALNNQLVAMCSVRTVTNILRFRPAAEDFEGTIPTGFNTLDTTTWPNPPVTNPNSFFDSVVYSGNGVNPRSFAGFSFQPDLVWVKSTSTDATNHIVSDIIKGAGSSHDNNEQSADDAANAGGEIGAFGVDGFTVDAVAGNDDEVNDAAREYIAFLWKEDVLAGLDLVGYAGTGVAQNIAHSLGDIPEAMYVRNRDTAGSNNVYFEKVSLADPETDFLVADDSTAAVDDATKWDDTAPDASNFRVGTDADVNNSGDNHAAYLWRGIEGLSKFTSYVGANLVGAAFRNPYIFCGFKPKLVFIKNYSTGADWQMHFRDSANFGAVGGTDSSRLEGNENLDVAAGEERVDFCASGFKITSASTELNRVGDNYLVMAFAEVPFQFFSAFNQAPSPGAGALDLNFEIDATGDDPNQFGDGDLNLGFLISASGTGGLPKGDGVPNLAFQIEHIVVMARLNSRSVVPRTPTRRRSWVSTVWVAASTHGVMAQSNSRSVALRLPIRRRRWVSTRRRSTPPSEAAPHSRS
jgi:hypothetical protein